MSDNNTKTEIIEYDIERIKKGFIKWLDKTNKLYIEKEFNDPEERGTVTRTEDDDSLGYSFTTEFNFSMRKRKKEDMKKPIDDTEESEEEDSEKLKREKEHNKKYGVEIKQHFPFPEFDSGVPQEDNKGNK
jgi:hypothetical protein